MSFRLSCFGPNSHYFWSEITFDECVKLIGYRDDGVEEQSSAVQLTVTRGESIDNEEEEETYIVVISNMRDDEPAIKRVFHNLVSVRNLAKTLLFALEQVRIEEKEEIKYINDPSPSILCDSFDPLSLFTTSLLVNKERYSIREIEVYLHCRSHPDPFVHCSPEQQEYMMWYFHRHKTGTYKSGTFKGLDLTLGSNGIFFGVLIRAIADPSGTVIEGPCNVVDHILEKYGISDISTFTKGDSLSAVGNRRNFLLLTDHPTENKFDVYSGPRIGLNKDKDTDYATRRYRFVTDIGKIKKQKKSLCLHTSSLAFGDDE